MALLISGISFLIYFFLIRNAVQSAMRRVLSEYSTSTEMMQTLKSIEAHLSSLSNASRDKEGTFRQPSQSVKESNPSIRPSDLGEPVRLLVDGDVDFGRCSACGTLQRSDRTVCYKCGIRFAGLLDNNDT